MRGELAKVVFDPLKRFIRVLLQQGRVKLDADAAEAQPDSASVPSSAPREMPAGVGSRSKVSLRAKARKAGRVEREFTDENKPGPR